MLFSVYVNNYGIHIHGLKLCSSLQEPSCHIAASSPLAGHPDCNNEALHCLDCSTLVFCTLDANNEYVDPEYINCGNDASLPYCDVEDRQCTDVLPVGCPLNGYSCSGPGLFPDPTECNLYHICYSTNFSDYEYTTEHCVEEPNLFYNSKEFQCSSAASPCNIECGGVIGIIPYPNDERYYGLCLPDKLEIQMCPGNYRFNGINACDFTCKNRTPGLYAHIEDCHIYHRCIPGSDVALEEECPQNLVFNPISGACDTEDNVLCN